MYKINSKWEDNISGNSDKIKYYKTTKKQAEKAEPMETRRKSACFMSFSFGPKRCF
jgi:hypothetical protein